MKRSIRVSSLLRKGKKLLVVHMKRGEKSTYVLPGGTLKKGESLEEGAIREVKEETHLDVELLGLKFFKELFSKTDESIDLIFEGKVVGGTLQKGLDPEYDRDQPLHDVLWVELSDLKKLPFHPKQLLTVVDNAQLTFPVHLGRYEYPEKSN